MIIKKLLDQAAIDSNATEIGALARVFQNINSPLAIEAKDAGLATSLVLFPGTEKVLNLESYGTKPIRKRGTASVKDYQSFVEYLRLHRTPETVIFADVSETGGSFRAILDHHQNWGRADTGVASGDRERNAAERSQEAGWGDHQINFICEHTPEWKRWTEVSGKPQQQADLAQFIEDNLMDITNPEGGAMLDIVKSLEASIGGKFKSVVRLENGDREISYETVTKATVGTEKIEVPDHFKIKIPVFTNGPGYDMAVRFRYSMREGALTLRLELVRPHKVIELAMAENKSAIQSASGLQVLMGSFQAKTV